jgi:MerR family transcriptional regulator, heat shock protein HspR
MTRRQPGDVPQDAPVFVISVAATLAGMHPQTLRQYDRMGLVSPDRTAGRGRRYSARDIDLLREVQRLSQDEGINLAGIKRILELENHVTALRARIVEMQAQLEEVAAEVARREQQVHASYRRDLVPIDPSGPMVIWRGSKRG